MHGNVKFENSQSLHCTISKVGNIVRVLCSEISAYGNFNVFRIYMHLNKRFISKFSKIYL